MLVDEEELDDDELGAEEDDDEGLEELVSPASARRTLLLPVLVPVLPHSSTPISPAFCAAVELLELLGAPLAVVLRHFSPPLLELELLDMPLLVSLEFDELALRDGVLELDDGELDEDEVVLGESVELELGFVCAPVWPEVLADDCDGEVEVDEDDEGDVDDEDGEVD